MFLVHRALLIPQGLHFNNHRIPIGAFLEVTWRDLPPVYLQLQNVFHVLYTVRPRHAHSSGLQRVCVISGNVLLLDPPRDDLPLPLLYQPLDHNHGGLRFFALWSNTEDALAPVKVRRHFASPSHLAQITRLLSLLGPKGLPSSWATRKRQLRAKQLYLFNTSIPSPEWLLKGGGDPA